MPGRRSAYRKTGSARKGKEEEKQEKEDKKNFYKNLTYCNILLR